MLEKLESKIKELSTLRGQLAGIVDNHNGNIARLCEAIELNNKEIAKRATTINKIDGALEVLRGIIESEKAETKKPEPPLSDVAAKAIDSLPANEGKAKEPVVPPRYGAVPELPRDYDPGSVN
jgi:hypothetical protein